MSQALDLQLILPIEIYDGLEYGAALLSDGSWIRLRAIGESANRTGRAFLVEKINAGSVGLRNEMMELRNKYAGQRFMLLEENEFSPGSVNEFNALQCIEAYVGIGDPYVDSLSVVPVSNNQISAIRERSNYIETFAMVKSLISAGAKIEDRRR